MRAGQVGVGVDRLGLEPQAEVEAELWTRSTSGRRPLGKTFSSTNQSPSPARVSLRRCGTSRRRGRSARCRSRPRARPTPRACEVEVEVHRLPGVQQHRCAGCGDAAAAPAGVGGSAKKLVESLAPGCRQPRAPVALPRPEAHLAGQQQLAAAQQPPAGGGVLGGQHLVAAPGQVHAPHPARPEAEARAPGTQHRRRVVAGPAAPCLPHPLALVEGTPLRLALVGVPPCHVEQLLGLRRHRQGGLEVADLVGLVSQVPYGGSQPHQPAVANLELGGDLQSTGRVGGDAREPRRAITCGLPGQLGCRLVGLVPHAAVVPDRPRPPGPAARQPGTADPAGGMTRQDRHGLLGHHHGVDVGHAEGCDHTGESVVRQVAEVGSPVQHHGQVVRVEPREDAGAAPTQVHHPCAALGHQVLPSSPRPRVADISAANEEIA